MQGITIHLTGDEEILGSVTPVTPINFTIFDEEVRRTWKMFHTNQNISIEDFVEFHNVHSDIKIDYIVMDFIQL